MKLVITKHHEAQCLSGYHGWWRNPESNWGHKDFQSSALPTELFRRSHGKTKWFINQMFVLGSIAKDYDFTEP